MSPTAFRTGRATVTALVGLAIEIGPNLIGDVVETVGHYQLHNIK